MGIRNRYISIFRTPLQTTIPSGPSCSLLVTTFAKIETFSRITLNKILILNFRSFYFVLGEKIQQLFRAEAWI